MNVPEAEVAVVGLGSMGCQALWQVARRGVAKLVMVSSSVLVLPAALRFPEGRDRGLTTGSP